MDLKQPTILITGASGIVGSHLVLELLQQGHKIKLLVRDKEKTENYLNDLIQFYQINIIDLGSKIDWLIGDITDVPFLENALKDVKTVFHAAALVSVYLADTELMNKTNIEGTANLVNVAMNSGVEWFGFVSSVATLGPNPDGLVDEDYFWKPGKSHTTYATSKYLAEQEVWRAQEEGLKVLVVNPGFIIGPSFDARSSARIFHQIHKGLPAFINGSGGYVDVRDVAQAIIQFWMNDVTGKRIILSAENLTTKAFLAKVANAMKAKAPSKEVSAFLVQLAYRLDVILSFFMRRKPMMTRDLIKMASSNNQFDNNRSLQHGASYRSIDDSLLEIAPYYLQRLQK
jgi:nucleoside-diphosphate-sugar epimerase